MGVPKTTKVILDGKGLVTLRPNDHVATGGEGSIFKISDMVVKLYLNPEEMVKRGIHEKIKLLSKLNHPYIVSPKGIAKSESGKILGYYMLYADGHPLSRVFTNEFYQREGFTKQHASTLVDRMRQVFQFAHQGGAILVDPNELNWLMQFSKKDPEPRVVDVDSWAIGRWPATVIMPSIHDHHSNVFDEKSDWFSWGIVTFQVYTGIHPYKGTLDGFDRSDLTGRMKKNASVFTPGVRLNKAVRDFSCIPGPLLGWYEATFQKGERTEPPSPFDTGIAAPRIIKVLHVTTSKTGSLVYEKLIGFTNDPAIRIYQCGLALLKSGALVDLRTKHAIANNVNANNEIVKINNGWLLGKIEHGVARFGFISEDGMHNENFQFSLNAYRIITYENRMFAVTNQGLTEIKAVLFGSKIIVSSGQTWGVMVNSTKWFENFGVFDAMGAKFIIAPFSETSVAQVRVKELDGLQVISGKAGNRFISLIAVNKQGDYKKIEFTFEKDYSSYKVWTADTDGPELNLTVLPKGVCAAITKDGELTVFVPTNGTVVRIEDKQIETDMLLSNWENTVLYIQNGEVWSVRTR